MTKMNYSCKRCGYETDRVSNLRSHLKKKKTCKDVLKCELGVDLLLKEIEIDYGFECKSCHKKYKSEQCAMKHQENCMKKQDYSVSENPLFLI